MTTRTSSSGARRNFKCGGPSLLVLEPKKKQLYIKPLMGFPKISAFVAMSSRFCIHEPTGVLLLFSVLFSVPFAPCIFFFVNISLFSVNVS